MEKCLGKLIKNPKGKRQETQDKETWSGGLWVYMWNWTRTVKIFTHHKRASTVERTLNNTVQQMAQSICASQILSLCPWLARWVQIWSGHKYINGGQAQTRTTYWPSCYLLRLLGMGNYIKFSIWHTFSKKKKIKHLLDGKLLLCISCIWERPEVSSQKDRYISHIWISLSWLQALSSVSSIILGLTERLIYKHEVPHNITLD